MWSSRGVEGLQKAIGGGLKRGEVGFKGAEIGFKGTEGYGVGMEQLRRKRYYMKAF